MTYKRKDFAKALLVELNRGYDVERLADWACKEHLDHAAELEDGLDNEMMSVMVMGEGFQFHLSENELRRLIGRLMES